MEPSLTHSPTLPAGALVLVLTGLALAGCDRPAAQAQQAPSPAPQVGVVTVQTRSVTLTTELPGRTTAFLTADVRPQVSGVILQRNFTEGADVKANQQLYQIDPALYQATYDSAVASLQKSKAALATARAKAGRYRSLATAEAVSKQDYDDASASAKESQADISTAEASVEQARINLAYTKVQAPIDGRIGRSSVTPGALVTANQTTALATITQLDPIYVDVTQPATTLLRLRQELAAGKIAATGPNQAQVALTLEDGSPYPERGKLQFSEVNVDQGTGTVVIRAIFPNPNHLLLPGLYVREQIDEGRDDNAIVLPQQAVSRNHHGDPTVLVVGADDKVSLRVVQTSRAVGDAWIVSGGLKSGERIVVDGLQKAQPGAVVNAVAVDPNSMIHLAQN